MEASIGEASVTQHPRPRPHYKALWQAEKKRADDLQAFLNPPRFETAPTNQRITEPVVVSTERYDPSEPFDEAKSYLASRNRWATAAVIEALALVVVAIILLAR